MHSKDTNNKIIRRLQLSHYAAMYYELKRINSENTLISPISIYKLESSLNSLKLKLQNEIKSQITEGFKYVEDNKHFF